MFFEGRDFKIVRKLAKKLDFDSLASGIEFIVMETEGVSQNKKVENAVWTFTEILKTEIKVAAIFDRDYRSDEEVERFLSQMRRTVPECYMWKRKEIENYLIDLDAIAKALAKSLADRDRVLPEGIGTVNEYVQGIFDRVCEDVKPDLMGNVSKGIQESRGKGGKDISTLLSGAIAEFERNWRDVGFRINMCPGKLVLSSIIGIMQRELGVTVTRYKIIDQIRSENIPHDMRDVLQLLDNFARS